MIIFYDPNKSDALTKVLILVKTPIKWVGMCFQANAPRITIKCPIVHSPPIRVAERESLPFLWSELLKWERRAFVVCRLIRSLMVAFTLSFVGSLQRAFNPEMIRNGISCLWIGKNASSWTGTRLRSTGPDVPVCFLQEKYAPSPDLSTHCLAFCPSPLSSGLKRLSHPFSSMYL